MNDEIYERLKTTARNQDTAYYSDIAPLASLDMSNPEDRNKIADLLGEISLQEHREHHPLLSGVVIHKEDNNLAQGSSHSRVISGSTAAITTSSSSSKNCAEFTTSGRTPDKNTSHTPGFEQVLTGSIGSTNEDISGKPEKRDRLVAAQ
jgi:hypothetical protein